MGSPPCGSSPSFFARFVGSTVVEWRQGEVTVNLRRL